MNNEMKKVIKVAFLSGAASLIGMKLAEYTFKGIEWMTKKISVKKENEEMCGCPLCDDFPLDDFDDLK